jgi:hypothetical protein
MSRKTAAQWRREVPEYDDAIRCVEKLARNWPAPSRAPHVVAHLDPDTRQVSFILRGFPSQLHELMDLLGVTR